MSTLHRCDYPDCEAEATYRIVATPYAPWYSPQMDGAPYQERGIDTCDAHYDMTHPGKQGGGWWDEIPAALQSRR